MLSLLESIARPLDAFATVDNERVQMNVRETFHSPKKMNGTGKTSAIHGKQKQSRPEENPILSNPM